MKFEEIGYIFITECPYEQMHKGRIIKIGNMACEECEHFVTRKKKEVICGKELK